MESILVFVFISILALMFIAMLYGERLSLLGIFDGEWFSPIGILAARMWNGLCEAFDASIEFVLAHLSWVVAAVSGTAGLVLIAFLMGGGLASDAAAYHRDTMTPLQSGGVIDKVPVVTARSSQSPGSLAKADRDDSQLLNQSPSIDYLVFDRPEYTPIRPKPRRPIDGGYVDSPTSRPITDRPMLDVTFHRLGSTVIEPEFNPDVVTVGRLAESLPDAFFVDRVLRRLQQDDWRESIGLPGDAPGTVEDILPESPLAAVRDLESRVRVTPGVLVAEHDLRVEKTVPRESATGEITIQLSLTNLSNQTIDGLLVREILPTDTQVRGAVPNGILRGDRLTWLVDDLRPSEEHMLRFTVLPSDRSELNDEPLFESMTEVSALTAVTTRTEVASELPLKDPFPSDRERREPAPIERRESPPMERRESPPRLEPELVGTPDLKLEIAEPDTAASVGEWTKIVFTLLNEGTADAANVKLRLTLDEALDHSELLERPAADRQVFVSVPRLRAGESRRFRLEVRPNARAETVSTAEILYDGAQIDLKTFHLVTRENRNPQPEPDSAFQ